MMTTSPRLQRFDLTTLPAAPWKNGGGTTREIVRMPAGAGLDSFDWRISVAEISSSGEFSTFPGIDRVIVLLRGEGVYMDGVEHRLDTPLIPFSFRGEDPISATLLGGVSTDFNVMTRRDRVRANVRLICTAETLAASPSGVLFAARGEWTANAEPIPENTGVWWSDTTTEWQLATISADAALIVVSIDDR